MFIRLAFLLLFALNLGAAAWLLFGRPPSAPVPPATDPGVPELRVVTAAARPTSAAAAQSVAHDRCAVLGPFATDVDMRAALQALSPHVARIQFRVEQVSHLRGYWVFLPAAVNHEAALAQTRRLAAAGVRDYYVVNTGDQPNTVSLGLFNDRANAEKRREQVQRKGFAARVDARTEAEPAWWLDYAVPSAVSFDWQAWLPGRNELQSKSIACF